MNRRSLNRRSLTVMILSILALLSLGTSQVLADAGDWLVRSRLIVVSPDATATEELTGLDVDSNFTIEVDATYFFTKNWAIEGIAATSSHNVVVEDSEPTKASTREFSLGSASLLPPTVLVQYHFLPDGKIRPYLGAGFNYTVFYDQTGVLAEFEDLDSSFGFAAQAGIDFMINDTMSFNIDLKYIDLDTDVEVRDDGELISLGNLELNPWVFGFGVGWRF